MLWQFIFIVCYCVSSLQPWFYAQLHVANDDSATLYQLLNTDGWCLLPDGIMLTSTMYTNSF